MILEDSARVGFFEKKKKKKKQHSFDLKSKTKQNILDLFCYCLMKENFSIDRDRLNGMISRINPRPIFCVLKTCKYTAIICFPTKRYKILSFSKRQNYPPTKKTCRNRRVISRMLDASNIPARCVSHQVLLGVHRTSAKQGDDLATDSENTFVT